MTIYNCEDQSPSCANCDCTINVPSDLDWYQGEDLCGECAQNKSEHLEKRVQYLEGLLRQCERHCVCTRNTVGFDYGEIHKKLGKPGVGKRWWTVSDIVKYADMPEDPVASKPVHTLATAAGAGWLKESEEK